MRSIFLTVALAGAMLVGSLATPDTAEAQRRWRGGWNGYYSGRYYRPSYYGPRYYSGYYAPRYYSRYYTPRYNYGPRYYNYGYRYSSRPGVYYGGRNAGFYFRF